jgi:cyanophycinase
VKRVWLAIPILLASVLAALAETRRGTLVIVGGGATPTGLHRKLLDLGGGTNANVLVIPLASPSSDGAKSVEAFHRAGAGRVSVLTTNDHKTAAASVGAAQVIWFPGGSQSQLMTGLKKLDVVEAIRERFARGAVVAGTSAGAAVMSKTMITGNPEGRDTNAVPPMAEGLGLWPEVIVDQHFVKRGRQPRLLAAVRVHPELVGVGIDEATAVIARDGAFEVIGDSSVTVVDWRRNRDNTARVLKAGDREKL